MQIPKCFSKIRFSEVFSYLTDKKYYNDLKL